MGVTEVDRLEPGSKDENAGADVTGHFDNLGLHMLSADASVAVGVGSRTRRAGVKNKDVRKKEK